MSDDTLTVLTAAEVGQLLRDEESMLMQIVADAYRAHGRGDSIVPHSAFLGLPGGRERIIALPAFLGGAFAAAGMKWIASFPGNISRGLARASGLVVLNSLETGRARAVIEGSLVSAKRTAASAVLAARVLCGGRLDAIGLVGCGVINFETLRFLLHVWPDVERVVVHDLAEDRTHRFVMRGRELFPRVRFEIVSDWHTLLGQASLVSIATTALTPYLDDFGGSSVRLVLHLSLRDLAPELILAADNVVDDADHVCRAETSLHLAERVTGGRTFIRCTLADLLLGVAPPRAPYCAPTIFSPFGLGILDIAVAKFVWERAEARGVGTRIRFADAAA